jgi:hypothetical protein
VGRQVVRDDHEVAGGVGVFEFLQELLVEGAVAGGGGHGDLVTVRHA